MSKLSQVSALSFSVAKLAPLTPVLGKRVATLLPTLAMLAILHPAETPPFYNHVTGAERSDDRRAASTPGVTADCPISRPTNLRGRRVCPHF